MAVTPLSSWLGTPPPYDETLLPFFKFETPPPYDETPLPFFKFETPQSFEAPYLESDPSFLSPCSSRDLQNIERIPSPTRYMKLACRDGDLWIRWSSWDITADLPVFGHSLDVETFVITLRRVGKDDVLELMTDEQPLMLPTLLDQLKCDGFTDLFDIMDRKALRTFCDFRNASFHPRKAWRKRAFLCVKAIAAITRVCLQSRE